MKVQVQNVQDTNRPKQRQRKQTISIPWKCGLGKIWDIILWKCYSLLGETVKLVDSWKCLWDIPGVACISNPICLRSTQRQDVTNDPWSYYPPIRNPYSWKEPIRGEETKHSILRWKIFKTHYLRFSWLSDLRIDVCNLSEQNTKYKMQKTL